MRAVEIIRKKREGSELSREEISFLVRNYTTGAIPDYQISAFLMAVYFRGMSDAEVSVLTEEMEHSGRVFRLDAVPGRKVDKHSTGGVGDKTSLILAPAVAAAGVVVPMISGRGLGHTGGTLDKLESIPGFNVRLTPEQFESALLSVGAGLIGQTEDIVPADRKLYALRDVTATIESVPLIAASIMSKKLAEGIDGLVLDIKTGNGAFMKSPEDADRLACAMVGIGKNCGKRVVALITDMNQPLGEWVGNSVEVIECLEALKGRGPKDLVELSEQLSAYCLLLGDAAADLAEAKKIYRSKIGSGEALEKFRRIIEIQGGDPRVVDDYSLLPHARFSAKLEAPQDGFVQAFDTEEIGLAMCGLGAGRETVDAIIDPAVGLRIHKKIGDRIQTGEGLCTLYYNDEGRYLEARERILKSFRFSHEKPESPALVKKVISNLGEVLLTAKAQGANNNEN